MIIDHIVSKLKKKKKRKKLIVLECIYLSS